ncbi:MAG TPA: 50S ribosomal protein L3 [Patescibacteria group bacterium]|nr:50S ribosomal protein L3 [Patescibacteria group bacterium]
MINKVLGIKKEMGATFNEGVRVPVTKVAIENCVVTEVKTQDRDGYWSVQLGVGHKKAKNITKPMKGHLLKTKDAKETPKYLPRFIKEIRTQEEPTEKVGNEIKASDIFVSGDKVSVTGVSKGKGFAGGVKRWHFRGGSKTHGQSDRWRAPGSIGQGTTPGRVYKGKHMAGHMGVEQIKVKGLKIVSVDAEKNEILVSGAIPGTVGGLVILERIGERKEQANA